MNGKAGSQRHCGYVPMNHEYPNRFLVPLRGSSLDVSSRVETIELLPGWMIADEAKECINRSEALFQQVQF